MAPRIQIITFVTHPHENLLSLSSYQPYIISCQHHIICIISASTFLISNHFCSVSSTGWLKKPREEKTSATTKSKRRKFNEKLVLRDKLTVAMKDKDNITRKSSTIDQKIYVKHKQEWWKNKEFVELSHCEIGSEEGCCNCGNIELKSFGAKLGS